MTVDAEMVGEAGAAMASELAAAGFGDALRVGQGGFGVVYRCTQTRLDRMVAVKVLTATSAEDQARFLREQQAMAALSAHPNIVAVLQVGELAGGAPFLVMPFCGRGSVQDKITGLGMLEVHDALRVGVKIAGALATAHRVAIVHRDVKPANMLITDYGEPALCDFGIARVAGGFQTATGMFAGSPAFTAPEVIRGDAPDAASDVYGLGASLFAALTGHAPFERRIGERMVAQFVRITREPPPDLSRHGVAVDVAAVIQAAMARDPADRPSPAELGSRLQRAQAGLGLPVDDIALPDIAKTARARAANNAPVAASAPAAPPRRGNLRPAPPTVVGRDAELARLRELLRSHRLVTVTGIGGIGKTAFAAHAAHHLRADFSNGVWSVELGDTTDPALLTQAVAAALGVRQQPGHTLAESVVGFLTSRPGLLLVLDNCEHLIDAAAALTETLLRGCPRLSIVTTSREVLDLDGEVVLSLAPLACPAPGEDPTPSAAAGYAAVELFAAAARAAVGQFTLTADNAPPVTEICARLEGIPLALELAAARLRALSLEQIAQGLTDRFALLRRARRGAPSRQHSLASCIDWSYQLCSPAEQQLWTHLSVFAGSFELPAAQHLNNPELTATACLNLLTALVDKSILTRTHHPGEGVRYRLLDTLRDYGRARLTDTVQHRLLHRHAGYYRTLLAHAATEWFTEHQLHWLHRISAEMANIREALRFSLTDDPAAALLMCIGVRPFWQFRGMIGEARQWLSLALSATGAQSDALRVIGLQFAAGFAVMQGDFHAARERIAAGRTLFAQIDGPAGLGLIDFDYLDAYLASEVGHFERAREGFHRALHGTDEYEVRCLSLIQIGRMCGLLGEPDDAIGWQERAVALAESRGDRYLLACAHNALGIFQWQQGRAQLAQRHLIEALGHLTALDEPWNSAMSLEALAWIAQAEGHPRRAATLMAAAQRLSGSAGTPLLAQLEMVQSHDDCYRRARAQLGTDDFEAAWSEGRDLRLDDAASFAAAGATSPARTGP